MIDDDELVALRLIVFTDMDVHREGSDLMLHVGFPLVKEEVRFWPPKENQEPPCDLLPGPWCNSDDLSFLQARDFFRAHGNKYQPEQDEAFWLVLEAKLTEKRAELLRADELWKRCECCNGEGVVKK